MHASAGWVYFAFVTDMFDREIVGWQESRSVHTESAPDALQKGIYQSRGPSGDLCGLVHHSDRGGQYRAIRHDDALTEQLAVASAGSRGDSDDSVLRSLELAV